MFTTRWKQKTILKAGISWGGSRFHLLQKGTEASRERDHDGWIISDDGGGELEEAQKVSSVQSSICFRSDHL